MEVTYFNLDMKVFNIHVQMRYANQNEHKLSEAKIINN